MKARPRSDAATPTSASWSLYKVKDVADEFGVSIDVADYILEKTGFNKAVRIREEIIRWKTNLIKEQREVSFEIEKLSMAVKNKRVRMNEINEMLTGIRNILRIPRENGNSKPPEEHDGA